MPSLKSLRKLSTIHLIFATGVLIPFQLLLLSPYTINAVINMENKTVTLFQSDFITFSIYFVMTILYCIIVSYLFSPKEIVNPIYIQIGTFIIFSFFIIYDYQQFYINVIKIEDIFGYLFLIGMLIIGIAGLFQFFIVRWVVGLIYSDCERKSYLINGSPNEIMKILGQNFIKSRDFKHPITKYENTSNPITIVQYENRYRNNVILAFGFPENNENKCIIATVAFHKSLTRISKSFESKAIGNSLINDIICKLKAKNKKYMITELKNNNNLVSLTAYSIIESLSKFKIEILVDFYHGMSIIYRRLIAFFIIVVGIFSVMCYFNYIDFISYLTIATPIVIALIFGIGIQLIKEFSTKKTNPFT